VRIARAVTLGARDPDTFPRAAPGGFPAVLVRPGRTDAVERAGHRRVVVPGAPFPWCRTSPDVVGRDPAR